MFERVCPLSASGQYFRGWLVFVLSPKCGIKMAVIAFFCKHLHPNFESKFDFGVHGKEMSQFLFHPFSVLKTSLVPS